MSIPDGFQSELYYLMIQYLGSRPETEQVSRDLIRSLEAHKLFEPRYDWQGRSHAKTYGDLQSEIGPRVSDDHLLKLSYQLCALSRDSLKDPCSTSGNIRTLLGRGVANLRTIQPPNVLRTLNQRALGEKKKYLKDLK